jgi:hypothetical protein
MNTKEIEKTLGIDWDKEDAAPVMAEEVSDDDDDYNNEEVDDALAGGEETKPVDVIGELIGPEKKIGHVEEDYEFTRKKMRSILKSGEEALEGAMKMVNEDPSSRGYEVLSTLLKTVSDMSVSFFDLQKRNKELHQGSLAGIGTKPDTIKMQNGIVFTGDSATMLEQLRQRKKDQQNDN